MILSGIIFFFALTLVTPYFMQLFNLPFSKDEYGLVYLLSRFAFLQVTDIRRVFYVIVPAGILPIVGLVFWKKQDPITKSVDDPDIDLFCLFLFPGLHCLTLLYSHHAGSSDHILADRDEIFGQDPWLAVYGVLRLPAFWQSSYLCRLISRLI